MEKKLIIHVGFGKTGTTFLQQRFFSKQKEICYIGVPIRHSVYKTVDLFVRKSDRVSLNLASDKIFKFLETQQEYNTFVISSENLLDYFGPECSTGQKEVDLPSEEKIKRLSLLCKNLHEKHGVHCKVVVTLRNQRAIIRAMYQELYRLGNLICNERSFYQKISVDQNYCFGGIFRYSQIIELLMRKFPEEILVLFYEEMSSSYGLFMNRLVNFLALKNPRIPKSVKLNAAETIGDTRQIKYALKFNQTIKHTDTGLLKSLDDRTKKLPAFFLFSFRLFRKALRFVEFLPPLRTVFYRKIIFEGPTNQELKKIYNQYYDDNRKLEKLLSVKLKKYGY